MKPIALVPLVLAVLAATLAAPEGARAQLQTGNLYGTVVDEQGAPLPGVTVRLSGQGPEQVQVTNAQGQFRFLGLPPGSRQIRTELEGFSTVDYPNVNVNTGRNTEIEVTMSAAVGDLITVTSESPLLDERRISTGATVSETELEKIPTARDPWAILQQTPGVLMDRINVGGNEAPPDAAPGAGGDPMAAFAELFTGEDVAPGVSVDYGAPPTFPAGGDPTWIATPRDPWAILQQTPGVLTDRINVGGNEAGQQSQFLGGGGQSSFSVDGVVITDMAALGSSPAYYDFDSFEEMQVSTGGSDATIATGGVVLNMVTKRGTNEWRGSGRYFISDEDWDQATDNLDGFEFGGEVGGPIIKDRLWIWGSYGSQPVELVPDPSADATGSNPFHRFIEELYRRGYTRGCNVPGFNVFTTPGTDCGPIGAQLQNVYGTGAFQGVFPDPFAGPRIHVGVGQPADGRVGSLVVDPSDPSGNTAFSTGTTGGVWKTTNFLTTDPNGPTWVPVVQETTWNQTRFGDDPTAHRLEDTHIFSSNFYLTGLYSHVSGGFQLVPSQVAPATGTGAVRLDSEFQGMDFYLGYKPPSSLYQIAPNRPWGFNAPSNPILPQDGPASFTFIDRKDLTTCPDGTVLGGFRIGAPIDLGNGSSFQPFVPVTGLPDPCTGTEGSPAWQNTFQLYQTERPQEQYKLDASNFFNTGNLSHELKFGAGYRGADVAELDPWSGTWLIGGPAVKEEPQTPAEDPFAPDQVTNNAVAANQPADNPYLQDTLTLGNLTLNLGLRYDAEEFGAPRTSVNNPTIFNPAFLNAFPTIPLNQTFGGRFRIRTGGGGDASRPNGQEGPGGSLPSSANGVAAELLAAAGPSILLVSNGQSTGEAFQAHVLSDAPVAIDGYAILEPVAAPAAEVARLAGEMDAAGAVQAVVEAYCFQFDGMVPAAGAAYRFAPPEVQQAFAPLARVLDAAERVKDLGGLTPDTALDTYFPAISQWAVWTKEKGFDLESFGEAWLEHVKKNVEQAGEQMTAELENAVKERIPGRWQDIQKILAEAGG
jgi:hypothetical protein